MCCIQKYIPQNSDFSAEQAIEQYVSALPVTPGIKQMVADRDFMRANPGYYLNYPYLFASVFGIKEELPALSVAGYLYYKSIIMLDHALDETKAMQKNFAIINVCQEECIKILSSVFPIRHDAFWHLWYKRKLEYLQAYEMDRSKSRIQTMDDYERLADYKSSIGKIAIDCLYTLSGASKEKEYQNLLLSHRYFYVAFQIMDDITDLRHDMSTGQFNIAQWTLESHPESARICASLAPDEKAKYFHLSGAADKLLDSAIEYLQKAQNAVQGYHLPLWNTEIIRMHNCAVLQKLNIHAYIKSYTVKVSLAQQPVTPKDSIDGHIKAAAAFLSNAQNENGCWEEIYNNAGLSDTWATAFILSAVLQKPHIVDDCYTSKGIAFLNQHKQDGLWGYNKRWMCDNDSSTFSLIAHTLSGVECGSEFKRWLDKQNPDGGFSTYPDTNELRSSLGKNDGEPVHGWTQSHTCVSAAALYLMALRGHEEAAFGRLLNFILQQQRPDSLWDAYWWTSPLYSTYFILKANAITQNSQLQEPALRAINSLLKQQNQDGSFGKEGNAFYTGLVIEALCTAYNIDYLPAVEKAVSWLRAKQYEDGSWAASHPMRIPSVDVVNPELIESWPVSAKGVNVRAEEYGRLFSTAMALKGLTSYAAISRK